MKLKLYVLPNTNTVSTWWYYWLGVTTVGLYLLQEILGWKWELLRAWQDDETYKQITGFVILFFILHQWYLTIARLQQGSQACGQLLNRHILLGMLAPIFFYAHAHHFGYAYLSLLSFLFFLQVIVGLCNREYVQINQRWYVTGWLTVHVAISVILLLLAGYHAYNSFYYE